MVITQSAENRISTFDYLLKYNWLYILVLGVLFFIFFFIAYAKAL